MYTYDKMDIEELIRQKEMILSCLEVAYYVLPKYCDPPESYQISDHCRKEALTEVATMVCRLHTGKTKDSLMNDLWDINIHHCINLLPENEVYEIVDKVYNSERQ